MNTKYAVAGLLATNAALVLAVIAQLQSASAADTPPVLRARAIELVDERGQVRAQLNVEPSGEAVFRLRDAGGAIRVKVGAGTDGSGLLLLDGATEPAIHLLAGDKGSSVTLRAKGKSRVIEP
jgi:hypothetical protein